MATYIVPPAAFPLDCALEAFDIVKSGDLSDKRLPWDGLTLAAYGAKVTIGHPSDVVSNEPERMNHVAEEDFNKVEQLPALLQERLSEAPAGTEAFKFGDGTIIKALLPLIQIAIQAWLAGRTTG